MALETAAGGEKSEDSTIPDAGGGVTITGEQEKTRQHCEPLSVKLLGQAQDSELMHVRQPR